MFNDRKMIMNIEFCERCGGIPLHFKDGLYWVITCYNKQCNNISIDNDEYDVIDIWNENNKKRNDI